MMRAQRLNRAAAMAAGQAVRLAAAMLVMCALSACRTSEPAPVEDDPSLQIVMPSRQLDDAQALTLEFDLMSSPRNLQYRVDLLWHYRGLFANPTAERAANRHVLWLIENRPRAAVLATPVAEIPRLPDRSAYDQAKALWMKIIEARPDDAKVLGNAGVFLLNDERARAVELLERAHRLDPDDATWPRHLAEGYREQALAAKDAQRDVLARLSITMYEKAAAATKSVREQIMLLLRAAALATRARDMAPKAVELAAQADDLIAQLEESADRAALKHNVHVVVGLSSLNAGKVDVARDTGLSLAGESIRGQSLSLTDLDLALAAALYERGEKEVVLKYLGVVETATGAAQATNWVRSIRAGEKPDFGPYLH